MQAGTAYELDLELARPIDEKRWIIARGEAKRDESGHVVGLRGTAIDITERKRAEKALRESEERFRSFAENIDSVFWIIDLNPERVRYVNGAFERIWSRGKEDIYANSRLWEDSIHPEDLHFVHERLEKWLAREMEDYSIEYRIIRPDGEVRWIAARGVRIYDEKGIVFRVAGIAEDITGRKQALRTT